MFLIVNGRSLPFPLMVALMVSFWVFVPLVMDSFESYMDLGEPLLIRHSAIPNSPVVHNIQSTKKWGSLFNRLSDKFLLNHEDTAESASVVDVQKLPFLPLLEGRYFSTVTSCSATQSIHWVVVLRGSSNGVTNGTMFHLTRSSEHFFDSQFTGQASDDWEIVLEREMEGYVEQFASIPDNKGLVAFTHRLINGSSNISFLDVCADDFAVQTRPLATGGLQKVTALSLFPDGLFAAYACEGDALAFRLAALIAGEVVAANTPAEGPSVRVDGVTVSLTAFGADNRKVVVIYAPLPTPSLKDRPVGELLMYSSDLLETASTAWSALRAIIQIHSPYREFAPWFTTLLPHVRSDYAAASEHAVVAVNGYLISLIRSPVHQTPESPRMYKHSTHWADDYERVVLTPDGTRVLGLTDMGQLVVAGARATVPSTNRLGRAVFKEYAVQHDAAWEPLQVIQNILGGKVSQPIAFAVANQTFAVVVFHEGVVASYDLLQGDVSLSDSNNLNISVMKLLLTAIILGFGIHYLYRHVRAPRITLTINHGHGHHPHPPVIPIVPPRPPAPLPGRPNSGTATATAATATVPPASTTGPTPPSPPADTNT